MFALRKAVKASVLKAATRHMGTATKRVLVHDAEFEAVNVEDFLRSPASLASNFEDRREYFVHYDTSSMAPEFPQPTGLEALIVHDEPIYSNNDTQNGWLFFVCVVLGVGFLEYATIGYHPVSLEDQDNFAVVARKEKAFSMSIGKRYQDIE